MAFQYQGMGNYNPNPNSGGNPFAITPGNNMLPGLNALGRGMETMGAQMKEKRAKEKAEATYTDIRTRMEAAQQMPDHERSMEIAKLHGEYPAYTEWTRNLGNVYKDAHGNHPTQKAIGRALQNAALDPDNAAAHLDKGITEVWQAGSKDTSRLEQYRKEWSENPELAMNKRMSVWSMFDPDGFAAHQAAKPDKKDLMGKVNPNDWTPASLAEYARTGDYGVLEAAIKPPSEMAELTRAIAAQTLSDQQQAAHTRRRKQAATTKAQQTEAQNRTTLEEGLPARYKNASEEEQAELMEVAQSAPNAMAARKEVEATRERQRKDKKAVGLTTKSVDLLASILENPELDDVIGPREGKEGSWFNQNRSGPESDAMADIRELVDLLTVPNLEIITGPMSDSDIAMVGRVAGGGMDRTRSEPAFRKRAIQLIGALGVPTLPQNDPAAYAALKSGDLHIINGKLYRKK